MIHIKKIKPLFTSIVTTGDKFKEDMIQNGILIAKKGELKLWQRVLAIGSSVRDVAIGDLVMINAEHFAVKKYDKNSLHNDMGDNHTISYQFNWVSIDNDKGEPVDCLLLDNRDVLYVFEGEEKNESLMLPDNHLITVI